MKKHGISKEDWLRRFHVQFVVRLKENPGEKVIQAEAETWLKDTNDWEDTLPEEAANESLSCWTDG